MTALLQPPTQTAAPTPQPAARKRRSFRALEPTGWGVAVRWVWLSLAGILSFFPFYAMVVLSLKPGMVVSMEPMVMLPQGAPGAGGYREHDILIVTEDGAENITGFPFGPEHNIIRN